MQKPRMDGAKDWRFNNLKKYSQTQKKICRNFYTSLFKMYISLCFTYFFD